MRIRKLHMTSSHMDSLQILFHKIALIKTKAILLLMFFVMLTGCSGAKYKESYYPLQEVNKIKIKYDVKMFVVQENSSLDVSNNLGNIEVYGWRDSKIKIEINNSQDVNNNNSSDSAYECFINDNKVVFKSKYQNEDGSLQNRIDLKIYIPRHMANLELNMKKCNLTIYDRIDTKINANLENGDVIIRSFEGEINANIKKGNITFESVYLKDKNNVFIEKGNISFKGSIDSNNISVFDTQFGNIKFGVHSSETAPLFECDGDVESNDLLFKKNPVSNKDGKVILKCNGGHIDLAEII